MIRRALALAALFLLAACQTERPPYGPRSQSGETAQATSVGEIKDLLAKRSIVCGSAEQPSAGEFVSDSARCARNGATYLVIVFDDEGLTRNWYEAARIQRNPTDGSCYLLGPRWALQMANQDFRFQDALGGTWAEHQGGGCGR